MYCIDFNPVYIDKNNKKTSTIIDRANIHAYTMLISLISFENDYFHGL